MIDEFLIKEGHKFCKKCHQIVPFSGFYYYKPSICKECHTKLVKTQKKKRDYIKSPYIVTTHDKDNNTG